MYSDKMWSKPPALDIKTASAVPFSRFLLAFLVRLPSYLVPSFLQPHLYKKENLTPEKIHPTAFLDGMRGLASFVVFLCHLSYGTWHINHAFGGGEDGENTSLLRLPIVRLLYSGPPMVAIFFVVSGYALSYKPLRLMRAGQFEELMYAMSSSFFRRAFRLFLPCFISMFLVACLAQMNLYRMTEEFSNGMRAVHEDHPWTAPNPYAQFIDWARKMFQFVNVFDWSLYAGSVDLDRHLWTIPVEFRASMVLFATHMMVARMSPNLRIGTLCFLNWWSINWNRWEMFPFWSGAILAELDMMRANREIARVSSSLNLLDEKEPVRPPPESIWWRLFRFMNFVCGLFLASYPDWSGHNTPGYRTLTSMIPEYFTEKHRFWPSFGAVQIVWAISNSGTLRGIFNSALLQYIGKISFPLYLVHGPVIHTFGYMVSRLFSSNI